MAKNHENDGPRPVKLLYKKSLHSYDGRIRRTVESDSRQVCKENNEKGGTKSGDKKYEKRW